MKGLITYERKANLLQLAKIKNHKLCKSVLKTGLCFDRLPSLEFAMASVLFTVSSARVLVPSAQPTAVCLQIPFCEDKTSLSSV